MNSISVNEQSCGNCQYWRGVRSRQGNMTILESSSANCPVAKQERSCRQNVCTKFVFI